MLQKFRIKNSLSTFNPFSFASCLLQFDPNCSKDTKLCILKILRLSDTGLGEGRLYRHHCPKQNQKIANSDVVTYFLAPQRQTASIVALTFCQICQVAFSAATLGSQHRSVKLLTLSFSTC